jgi:hypothetical protein
MGYFTNYSIEANAEAPVLPNKAEPCPCGVILSTKYCPECGMKAACFLEMDNWEALVSSYTSFPYMFEERVKWYDHRKDMIRVSKDYPDVLFTLSGEGEEPGDVWKEYYLGGRYQEAKGVITFPEFDASKLK